MPKKTSTSEARLILELYDLRREPEMRKARQWWAGTFWPGSADDFLKVAWATVAVPRTGSVTAASAATRVMMRKRAGTVRR